jgi:acetoin utilization protein AcuC
MRKVDLVTSPEIWQRGHGPNHPLKPERLLRTYELITECGLLDPEQVNLVYARTPQVEELCLFHDLEYINAVRALSEGEPDIPAHRYGFGPGDNPVFGEMYQTEGLKVGAAFAGAERLLQGECDVAFSYTGGMHHAGPNFASGFCVFNDAAVVIHWLLLQGLRVAYVDIDVHHGDGVQDAFYDTDKVLTISLHQSGRTLFPGTGFIHETGKGNGEGYSVNIPLPPYTDDRSYIRAFQETVPELIHRFKPDILVTQLGVDTHYLDPLASLALTTRGQREIFETLRELDRRWLALGGGGYNLDVVPRAWTIALAVMSDQEIPQELPTNYQAKYGGRWLEDRESPKIDPRIRELSKAAVEDVIIEVKKVHGLQ